MQCIVNVSRWIIWICNQIYANFLKLSKQTGIVSFSILQGVIQQLRGQNFAIFLPPSLRGQFLYPERGQKQTFFDPLPPSSCPRSYWMPPYEQCYRVSKLKLRWRFELCISKIRLLIRPIWQFFLALCSSALKKPMFQFYFVFILEIPLWSVWNTFCGTPLHTFLDSFSW